jgi:mono/diheme cytochrome c family protein
LPAAPPHTNAGHTWHHPDRLLEEIVLKGSREVYRKEGMPAFENILTQEEVRAILGYLRTWWGEEQRGFQVEVTKNDEKQR